MNVTDNGPLAALDAIPSVSPDTLLVSTLGGVANIGMNWTLYGNGDAFILVDAGTTFAPRTTVGVEAVLPDPKIFQLLGNRLKGLVVTHFHEDHVGAIHRFWPRFAKCPIYAPPFAARMLTGRFQEAGTKAKVRLKTFTPGADLSIGPFKIRTVRVAHSTPDCVGLCIETKQARVVHTGDWKFDPEPGIGSRTDFGTFAALGAKGVDLMLCDSTNANRDVPQSSEASVRRAMTAVFKRAKGMVFVSSFGSNVARMASVAFAAKAARRKVALAGRSLRNAAEAAEALGLTKGVPPFLKDATKFNGTERRGCVLMCTGTQGEENAALSKLAFADGRDTKLPRVMKGDVVVHSARIIPGNEDYVNAVLDRLEDLGAEIVTADNLIEGDPVHVTGHPCRADLRMMYQAVRPKIAMPIHGTPVHLDAHAELALSLGVSGALTPIDGGVYQLSSEGLACLGRLTLGRVAVMGDGAETIVPWDDSTATAVLTEPDQVRLDGYLESERERAERRLANGDRRGRSARQTPRGSGRDRTKPERSARPERSTRLARSVEPKTGARPERTARPHGTAKAERGPRPDGATKIATTAKTKQGARRKVAARGSSGDPQPVYGAQTRRFEVETRRSMRPARDALREPALEFDR